jgi:demethylmenaquinone methyltransferase/2-methoxy-6-polyprenyl-1,4-benzoquinol methylase
LTGLDLTPAMLDIGRKKLNRAGASAELWTGDASAVPAPNASFDVVTMGFGLRNLEVPRQGLKEMQRLLTPGGKALILEFAPCRPNLLGHCYRCYLRHIIPHIGAWLTGSKQAYTHLCTSIQGFWGPEQMIRIMQDVGFQDVQAEPLSGKIAYLYAGTNHDA